MYCQVRGLSERHNQSYALERLITPQEFKMDSSGRDGKQGNKFGGYQNNLNSILTCASLTSLVKAAGKTKLHNCTI